MSYQCLVCGAKQKTTSAEGACNACGAYQLKKSKSSRNTSKQEGEKPSKTLPELIAMILLWGVLIYGVWDRYLA